MPTQTKSPAPWMPDTSCPPQPKPAAKNAAKETFEVPPDFLFPERGLFTVDRIASLAGIPKEIVRTAADAHQIGSVISYTPDHQKCWRGNLVAAWIRGAGHKCLVDRQTYAQFEADQRGAAIQAERAAAEKRRAEAERERVAEMFRDAAADPAVVRTVELLAYAESQKLSITQVLRAVKNA